ncbi:hypothetical protein QH494_27425 [Sphingomonas sp. AR_OL41]|uniref:hypothetical protein n=1 Tax=Sphingomonas sp. AR_OL41 TaxID=3042729 RepID=UPI002480D8AC|nr:hypothetical protein [Sphingomonas sp. AR_OL41]MDH7975927.1 hypothetical protein [Sphingomonas sp. AR_OL41]
MGDLELYGTVLGEIEQGNGCGAMTCLALQLAMTRARAALRDHPLHLVLLEDPHTHRARFKPRGYAGDAPLIDFYYDQQPPARTSERGRALFEISSQFETAQAVRWRLATAQGLLEEAWAAGQRICSLACGHFREADALAGRAMGKVIAVDQDRLSLATVRARPGASVVPEQANVLHYLRAAARRGERFDLIYTLGLTDYLDERAMDLLYRLMNACLAPQGRIVLATFLPDHLGAGWLDACMDWHLVCRDEVDLARHARKAGLDARTFRDPTDSIVWCEMRAN